MGDRRWEIGDGRWEIGDGRRGTTKHTKYTKEKKGQGGLVGGESGTQEIMNGGGRKRSKV